MKTIIDISDNTSLYILEDDEIITLKENEVSFGDPEHTFVCDLNLKNCKIIENITPPEDWDGCKYCFDGINWTASPKWRYPQQDGSPTTVDWPVKP